MRNLGFLVAAAFIAAGTFLFSFGAGLIVTGLLVGAIFFLSE
jgi:hypothetical protein